MMQQGASERWHNLPYLTHCDLTHIGLHLAARAVANELFSTRVLANTGSTLIQAANDEERAVGQRTWDPKGQGLEEAPPRYMYIFRSISRLASYKWNSEALSFHKFQQLINWLQKNCNRKWKFATGNRKKRLLEYSRKPYSSSFAARTR